MTRPIANELLKQYDKKAIMKPSIEEVREYFKDAKVVRCIHEKKNRFISDYKSYGQNNRCIYVNNNTMDEGIGLYSEAIGYAEIVEYKTKPEVISPFTFANEVVEKAIECARDIKKEVNKPKIDPIVTSVMTQLLTRSQLGITKYGTTLQDNNTDDFLQHLKEELMDSILYIEKLQSLKTK